MNYFAVTLRPKLVLKYYACFLVAVIVPVISDNISIITRGLSFAQVLYPRNNPIFLFIYKGRCVYYGLLSDFLVCRPRANLGQLGNASPFLGPFFSYLVCFMILKTLQTISVSKFGVTMSETTSGFHMDALMYLLNIRMHGLRIPENLEIM